MGQHDKQHPQQNPGQKQWPQKNPGQQPQQNPGQKPHNPNPKHPKQ